MHVKSKLANRRMRTGTIKSLPTVGLVVLAGLVGGCAALRPAPGEAQKQNAYLHHQTVQAAAYAAKDADAPEPLPGLLRRACEQSEAIVAYYGFPQEIPATNGVDQLVGEQNAQITRAARTRALQRVEPWDVTDQLLELGIALAGVLGGVYGGKAVSALQLARQKSQALREIVEGNERFKHQSQQAVPDFKNAHQLQSPGTRQLVAALK